MVEVREHKIKALLLSLVVHVLIFVGFLGLSNKVIKTNQPIEIDLNIEKSDAPDKGSAGSRISFPVNNGRGINGKQIVKGNEPEIWRQQTANDETEKKPVGQSDVSIDQTAVTETRAPAVTTVKENFGSNAIIATFTSAEGLPEAINNLSNRGGSNISGMRMGMIGLPGDRSGVGSNGGMTNYLKENFSYIRDMIQKKVIYPKIARQMGWQGKVTVSCIVFLNGMVKDVKIMKTSGIEVLDSSAREAVKDAAPFPKPPAEAQIIIPIVYKLN